MTKQLDPIGSEACPADVYLRNCPSRAALNLISGRWSALIIGALERGPRRFGELRRQLDGVTQKVMTDKLRALERDGIVLRSVIERPLEVRYELTALGRSLIEPIAALRAWAEEHVAEVRQARELFDAGAR